MSEIVPSLTLPKGKIGPFPLGGRDAKFFLVARPCVIESLDHCLKIARVVRNMCDKLGIHFMFKASFDKANRSSLDSYRGPGLEKGLEILAAVKDRLGVPVLSDIHVPD